LVRPPRMELLHRQVASLVQRRCWSHLQLPAVSLAGGAKLTWLPARYLMPGEGRLGVPARRGGRWWGRDGLRGYERPGVGGRDAPATTVPRTARACTKLRPLGWRGSEGRWRAESRTSEADSEAKYGKMACAGPALTTWPTTAPASSCGAPKRALRQHHVLAIVDLLSLRTAR